MQIENKMGQKYPLGDAPPEKKDNKAKDDPRGYNHVSYKSARPSANVAAAAADEPDALEVLQKDKSYYEAQKPEEQRTEVMKIFGDEDLSALNGLVLRGKIRKVHHEVVEKELVEPGRNQLNRDYVEAQERLIAQANYIK